MPYDEYDEGLLESIEELRCKYEETEILRALSDSIRFELEDGTYDACGDDCCAWYFKLHRELERAIKRLSPVEEDKQRRLRGPMASLCVVACGFVGWLAGHAVHI